LLTGPIPDSVALETAEIIDREDEFRSRFGEDEYKPDFYAAIEGALARSGALLDGKFGALGALTADEVLEDEPISNRRHGWVVRVGVGFQASDLSGLADNDPKLLAQWEYAKPFGYKGQFINLFSFEPVFGDETLTSFRNEMSYTYELTDVIDWINTWDLTYTLGDDMNGDSLETTNHILTSRYSFDIGNTLDYFVGLRLNQTDIDPNEPGSFGDSPEIQFESGFNYRLTVADALPESLQQAFIKSTQKLITENVSIITTTCGFLSTLQKQLATLSDTPVICSSLALLPLLTQVHGGAENIGVLTFNRDTLNHNHFGSIQPGYIEIESKPDTRAIVLECTNLSPYKNAIREQFAIAVYDIVDAVHWLLESLNTNTRPGP